ncbi:hypothetical protein B4R02_01940 [Salmonella enterica]|nr:hypothetical protein [Salmonella enterica]EBE3717867.1 hypothetical protein [Salmonella enterica subsp. diarizonae serovar 42:l,v:1,5,7]ECC9260449.1 hypothetical protein [Salmonella enterica subsp. diarizonae]EAU6880733.1 hypothetical protein [Salmonella enterica]EBI5827894.1 hypothetical protein [Salmonella enterica]
MPIPVSIPTPPLYHPELLALIMVVIQVLLNRKFIIHRKIQRLIQFDLSTIAGEKDLALPMGLLQLLRKNLLKIIKIPLLPQRIFLTTKVLI